MSGRGSIMLSGVDHINDAAIRAGRQDVRVDSRRRSRQFVAREGVDHAEIIVHTIGHPHHPCRLPHPFASDIRLLGIFLFGLLRHLGRLVGRLRCLIFHLRRLFGSLRRLVFHLRWLLGRGRLGWDDVGGGSVGRRLLGRIGASLIVTGCKYNEKKR